MGNGQVQDEIGDMNKSFNEGIATESVSTESPGTESPGTEQPGTKAPGTESPGTDAPGTSAPSTKAPVTEVPTTEVPDEKDQVIEDLRKQLAEKDKKDTTTKAPTTEAPLVLDEHDFVGDSDLDELSRDPKKFNKLLNDIYQKAVTDTRKVLGEGVLRTIPDIVKTNITMMTNLKKVSDKFYKDNEDLEPFRKVVSAVFEDVAAENPDKRFDEILNDVAGESRKRLGLQRKAENTNKDKNKDKPPKLPRKKGKAGRATEKPNTEPLQDELDEMNKTLGR